jgi:hypothetical protein
MKSGGIEIACNSVLKLVRTIQKIGKKKNMAKTQQANTLDWCFIFFIFR